jgi:hypothetical protein
MSIVHTSLSYEAGSSGPDALLWWLDPATNDPVVFTDYTMSALVVDKAGATQFTPATVTKQTGTGNGRTSTDTANVVVEWASSAELSTLAAGQYSLIVIATHDSSANIRKREIALSIT